MSDEGLGEGRDAVEAESRGHDESPRRASALLATEDWNGQLVVWDVARRRARGRRRE
jgi:hypothetical protein